MGLYNKMLNINPFDCRYCSGASKCMTRLTEYAKEKGLEAIENYRYDAEKAPVWETLEAEDPIFVHGFGHGNTGVYTGNSETKIFWSGDCVNLAGRIVYLLSCYTGVSLGPAIIEKGGLAYGGYRVAWTWMASNVGQDPYEDKYAEGFYRSSNEFAVALIEGCSVGVAKERCLAEYDRWIEIWRERGNASVIKWLIHDRDGLVVLGDEDARLTSTGELTQIVFDREPPSETRANETFTIEGKLIVKETSAPIPNKEIRLFANSVEINSCMTDNDGKWTFDITLSPETYTLRLQFSGDDEYSPAYSKRYTIEVGVTKMNVTQEPPSQVDEDEAFVFAGALTHGGTGVSNKPIQLVNLTEDKIIDTCVTFGDGGWAFNVSFGGIGHHRIQARFLGDGEYTAVSTKEYMIAIGVLPYFGKDTRGHVLTSARNEIEGFTFECPNDGYAESISVYLQVGYNYADIKCAIYRADDYSLVGQTEERNWIPGGREFDWFVFKFPSPRPKLEKNTKYILTIWGSSGYFSVYMDSGLEDQRLTMKKNYSGVYPEYLDPCECAPPRDFNCSMICYYTPEEEPPKKWNLTVASIPNEVPVTLDGEDIGDTPITKEVAEGNHNVSVPSWLDREIEYVFKEWEDGSTSPSRIVNVTSDTEIIVTYEEVKPQPRELTIQAEPINVPVKVDNALVGDTPITVAVEEGSHLVEIPSELDIDGLRYRFVKWEDDSTDPKRVVEVLSDMIIKATYEEIPPPVHTLVIEPNINGDTSPPYGSYQFIEGTEVEITAHPIDGFLFDYWDLDGSMKTSNPIVILMDKDHNLQPFFKEETVPPPAEDKIVLSIVSKDSGEIVKVTVPCKIES